MPVEGALVGYVALSYADVKAFNDSGVLRPEIFSYPEVWGRYTPLDTTVEWAIETALLQTTKATLEVARRDTKWYVLKLTFCDSAVARLFQAGDLHWSSRMHRLEMWSPILAEWVLGGAGGGSPKLEVIEVPLRQASFDEWADRVLEPQFSLEKWVCRATCEQCHQSWRWLWTPQSEGAGNYCAECWHAYCEDGFDVCESLHAIQQAKAREDAEVHQTEDDSSWHDWHTTRPGTEDGTRLVHDSYVQDAGLAHDSSWHVEDAGLALLADDDSSWHDSSWHDSSWHGSCWRDSSYP